MRHDASNSTFPLSRLVLVPLLFALLLSDCQSGPDLLGLVVDRIDKPASSDGTPVNFTIKPGDSTDVIAANLEKQKLIKSASVFRFLAVYYGVDKDLKAGDYELKANITSSEIIGRLTKGTVRSTTVTIPEGWRMEEVAQFLEKKGMFDSREFMRAASQAKFNYEFLASRPAGASLEGFLFPDTYRVPPKLTAEEFIDKMLQDFDTRFNYAMTQQAARSGMSIYQVLTLASIIEREAVVPAERPIIASVFLNRLKQNMLLDADPTVQYALVSGLGSEKYWKSELTREDLEVDSPYNTYRYPGLPPGPIANPGLASIKAVLEPATTDFLYFVAKPDGSHAFSATLDEHNQNVRTYGKP